MPLMIFVPFCPFVNNYPVWVIMQHRQTQQIEVTKTLTTQTNIDICSLIQTPFLISPDSTLLSDRELSFRSFVFSSTENKSAGADQIPVQTDYLENLLWSCPAAWRLMTH